MKTGDIEGIIREVNLNIYYSVYEVEDSFDLDNPVTEQERDSHRWFIVGTNVYKIGERFLGVRGLTELKSETMSWEDTDWACKAFEMVAVPSVRYERLVKA